MKTEAAAVGGAVPPSELDDAALVQALLEREDAAWREMMRRFGPLLQQEVRRTLGGALRTVLDSDAVHDAIAEFHAALLEDDMRKLRRWLDGTREARLASWLAMIARQIAVGEIRRALSRAARTMEERAADGNRGGTWIAVERAAGTDDEPAR